MGSSLSGAGTFKNVDRKSTRLNSSHSQISYAVFCLKTKKNLPDFEAITVKPMTSKATRYVTRVVVLPDLQRRVTRFTRVSADPRSTRFDVSKHRLS